MQGTRRANPGAVFLLLFFFFQALTARATALKNSKLMNPNALEGRKGGETKGGG